MINFHIIKWRNFLSTGNYFTEIKLDNNQNTLIVGKNGSGKSALLDALCFVLFGKAFRNINKPNLVNSINQKDCVVELTFDVNNKNYKIIRGIKPNIFEIYCNDILLNQDAASKDYQEILEKTILKLNFKSFTQIVILGSASFTPFMQLSAIDRRIIIEDLLDIQIFSTMNNILKNKLSINKEVTVQKKHELDLLEQKIQLKNQHIEKLKQNNDERIKVYELEIKTNENDISTLTKEVDDINVEVQELQKVVEKKDEIENNIKKITKLESKIENNLAKIRKDIIFFEEHDNCSTCRQIIDSSFKKEELKNLSIKTKKYEEALLELEKKLVEKQKKLSFISERQIKIQKKQVKIATNNVTISELNKYNKKIYTIIEELKNKKSINSEENKEFNILKETFDACKKDLYKLFDEKKYLEVANNLLKDTGIKTKIVRQYLPIINKFVNKYLSSLDFFVNFNLDESFKETIKSRHRDDFSYNNFSEGEKTRIDLSLMLTWRAIAKLKNSNNTNLLILDEVFDSSLDNNGTDYLMSILCILENTNLFIISHKGDVLQDKFKNIIRFEKVKNFSHIKNKTI